MKKLKLFAIQELWKYFLQYMNYEIKKMFVCNTLIIKCLFAILKLWKHEKFVCNTWIMKFLNVCSQYMNYENIFCNTWIMKIRNVCLQYMNYEKIKMSIWNTRIMKKLKYLFAIQEFNIFNIQYKMFVCNTQIMKNENICCQYMNYENIF